MGSAKSESFEMTTAASYSCLKPSKRRYEARFTSEPFSFVSMTFTRAPPAARGRMHVLLWKDPR
jgi:hypothetical protein